MKNIKQKGIWRMSAGWWVLCIRVPRDDGLEHGKAAAPRARWDQLEGC